MFLLRMGMNYYILHVKVDLMNKSLKPEGCVNLQKNITFTTDLDMVTHATP